MHVITVVDDLTNALFGEVGISYCRIQIFGVGNARPSDGLRYSELVAGSKQNLVLRGTDLANA